MSYIDRAGLEARFGRVEIAHWLGLAVEDDDAAFDAALAPSITDVGAEIDGYLRGRTSLPVDPATARLVAIAADLVRYVALTRRGAQLDEQSAEYRAARLAREALRAYVRGEIDLGLPASTGHGLVEFETGRRDFERSGGW